MGLGLLVVIIVIVAVVSLGGIGFVVGIYNKLVTLMSRFKNAFSQIEVQLQRRYDLIPNLVEAAKGYLKHEKKARRYIYSPTVAPARAKRSALKSLLATFFDNSAENLVAALLDPKDQKLSDEEIERIHRLIEDDRAQQEEDA